MTATLETTVTVSWGQIDHAAASVRAHTDRHRQLVVGSLGVHAAGESPGRVEVFVPAPDQPKACAGLLAWMDTLDHATLVLRYCDDDPQARAYAQLSDGTPITVVAPLDPTRLHGVESDRTGEWVLHWLRWQAVETA
ncbi:hypothetical protein [Actinokineospora globicatena]|uniref:hypothetical protein n=1 Tax=Actinokineospora globicatena TaxID=103729 RepID=UPI0020A38025|nr:hypothetical protein [Actinokineospora globicatena]MCP2301763.1 hypothetical protein [Actinokineospora globicatena]GLW76579.1 hypothetical protein Aglo01_10610 [Actinokineospora globicatena]GLW83413.1 hypothetical protein Aglo02_10530 [Actinokineospora globicatena]